MRNIKYSILFLLLILIGLSSCVNPPVEPAENDLPDNITSGALILCEGLYGQSNSTISIYDNETHAIYNKYLAKKNQNYKLGDIANDILVCGEFSVILVTNNNKIVFFETNTGKVIKELEIGERKLPRKIIKYNDSLLLFSNLLDNTIEMINTKTLNLEDFIISTGPAPEGIAIYNDYLFIANSGYGDYLSNEKDAGTIYVIDLLTRQLVKKLYNVPNVLELDICTKTKKLYARYNNLPRYQDSLGGIVEYDLDSLVEIRRWYLSSYCAEINENGSKLYYLSDDGLNAIELNEISLNPKLIIEKNNSTDVWYSIKLNEKNDEIWISNAKNYQTEGEILIYNLNLPTIRKNYLQVGLNPNTITFF